MTAIGPYTESYDMRHQWDFVDLRGEPKCFQAPKNSVMDALNNIPDFSIFRKLVLTARLQDFFSGPYLLSTVFVPSDIEFKKKYPEETFDNIDIGQARKIVLFSTLKRRWTVRNCLLSFIMFRADGCSIYTI